MSNTPSEYKYAETHEWALLQEDGNVAVGITDHAQESLGDIVYVELPEEGAEVIAGDETGVVESVKAASDIYSPVSGTVVAVNTKLVDEPEIVNQDAFGDGWFYKVKPKDPAELEDLMDAEAYKEMCEAEEH